MKDLLKKAYGGSYYTIVGCGGDLEEWKAGYQKLLDKEEIGTIKEWIQFEGKDVNETYNLEGNNRFQDDLHFLAFPLTGLNINRLAVLRLQMQDRWFDDLIDNSLR